MCRLVAGTLVGFQLMDFIISAGWELRSSTAREGRIGKLEFQES